MIYLILMFLLIFSVQLLDRLSIIQLFNSLILMPLVTLTIFCPFKQDWPLAGV